MNSRRFRWAVFSCVLLLASPALAAEVFLKNGNRLTASRLSLAGGKLVLETDFAGRLTIDWRHVERIYSDEPLTVVLADDSRQRGITTSAQTPGRLDLIPEGRNESVSIDWAEIKDVNPPDEPPLLLTGRINIGLNRASGNTEKESGHVGAELIGRTARHRLTLGGAYNRAEDNDRKSEDNTSGHLKHDYFLTKRLYGYLNGLAERDEFKDINLRTAIGPGLGFQVFEGELMNLNLEAGPSWVRTDYEEAGDENSASGRWAIKLDRFFFDKIFQYYFTNEGYISSEDAEDVFMFTRTGLRFPVRSGLFLNAAFEWDWDNMPAEDADRSDYRYILSIGYGF